VEVVWLKCSCGSRVGSSIDHCQGVLRKFFASSLYITSLYAFSYKVPQNTAAFCNLQKKLLQYLYKKKVAQESMSDVQVFLFKYRLLLFLLRLSLAFVTSADFGGRADSKVVKLTQQFRKNCTISVM